MLPSGVDFSRGEAGELCGGEGPHAVLRGQAAELRPGSLWVKGWGEEFSLWLDHPTTGVGVQKQPRHELVDPPSP